MNQDSCYCPWSPVSNHHMPYAAIDYYKGSFLNLIRFVGMGKLSILP